MLYGISYMQGEFFCHWDLKPENILIDDQSYTLKIADFGAASDFYPE